MKNVGRIQWVRSFFGGLLKKSANFSTLLKILSIFEHYIFQLLEELKVTGHYIFQLFRAFKVAGCNIFQLLEALKVTGCYVFQLFRALKVTASWSVQNNDRFFYKVMSPRLIFSQFLKCGKLHILLFIFTYSQCLLFTFLNTL